MVKKFKEFISEFFNKKSSNQPLLLEIAYNRSDFINEMKSNKTREIIRSYALVYYAHRHENYSNLVDQWRGELSTLITDIQDMETKPKIKNRGMVYKAIYEVWIKKMELNKQHKTIIHKFIAKFNDEGIKCSEKEYEEIAESFIKNIENLMKEMSYGTYGSTQEFIKKI